MQTKSMTARARRIATAKEAVETGNICLVIADSVFTQQGIARLQHVDTWTGEVEYTQFASEVELCKFLGEFLKEQDGPTKEAMKRFPRTLGPTHND